ncbi:MAG: CBS domain-containing protein [Anaerolineae bacterium]|nr:CBS domain-containing protein [Anaerolineae bacterium]
MTEKRNGNTLLQVERGITDETIGQITRVEELFYELKIADSMTRDPKVVTPDVPMRAVLELFRQARISGAPVVDHQSALVGIISIEDLIRALVQGDLDVPLEHYMTHKVITVQAQNPVIEALKTFAQTRVGRLPVLDENGHLVGIITKGDITRGVLKALQREIQLEELKRYRASHLFEDIVSDRTSLVLRYYIKPRDFAHGGQASHHIKRALLRLGAPPQIARRCGIAAYEAEMNLIIHTTNGGVIRVGIEPTDILIETFDDGPGIPDIQLAMTPGYSTAPEEVREMGFGAGMGLKNIERCADSMQLESTPGKGTHLTVRIYLQPPKMASQDHKEGVRKSP